ncbi:MAG: Crp/Fnr family transcriptional regulator [Roseiflexus sp.]|nr:Crp/Fnr family transcriptional regulator [Roseiflexus sp.]MCS7288773.1 Crp/Fnr family transcriptional regulator [Roseiflexus sp.]MDW8147318.1 Crp/Fnr family transcriptional regulator [Roseiflexaceae bacterium]MDW8233894.1 Crp/Fnr family transcriptional regulator [Roseiflexaceae bacterium]
MSNALRHNPATAWSSLIAGRASEHAERGTLIYTPDSAAHDLFVLHSGTVRLHLRSSEGRTLTLRIIEAGQLFGHVGAGDETHYDTFAEAISAVQYVRIPRSELADLLAGAPELGIALVEDMAQHRAVISRRLDEVAFKSVPARLASLLLDLARRHGGPHAASVPRHSHRQLADMINAYRETVTKVINQFRDAHLLEIDRSSITLVNVRRLEELAQS